MGSFGDPQYAIPPDDPNAQATQPGQDAPLETIDPNDPAFTSELLDVNLEANVYEFPPPPPAGIYRAKGKLLQVEDAQKQKRDWLPAIWGRDHQKVAVMQMEATIIDPTGKYDGIRVFDRNVSTFMGRDKGHKMQTILTRLKRPDGSPWVKPGERMTVQDWANRLALALAGEPEFGVEIDWEWSCVGCAKHAKEKKTDYPPRVKGMQKFPPEQDANKRRAGNQYSPEMKCQVNPGHMYSRAQLVIARVLSLAELAAIQGHGAVAKPNSGLSAAAH